MTSVTAATEVLGREVVLASAGSGKTYRLSSKLIGLLAIGVPPEEILASTFTRKAAGEITSRVLLRLAEGASHPGWAKRLAEAMPPGVARERVTQEGCAELLAGLVRNLHRLQVLTLDAFFYRIAHAFAMDLGLPQTWKLAEDPDRRRLSSRAIESTLRELDPGVLAELVRGAGHGAADRAVHRLLYEGVQQLHGVFRLLDPSSRDPWGLGSDAPEEPDMTALERWVARFEDAELPRTKAGKTDSRWEKARAEGIQALRAGEWEGFLTAGLPKAMLERGGVYGSRDIPSAIRENLMPLIELAKAAYILEHDRRIAALGRFLPEYDRRITRIQREEGLYHFDDLTHSLGGMDAGSRSTEIAYRLDQRIRHLLLDEFQDTSHAQWAALESFTAEIFWGEEPDRALFVVADPKQSIYGWRGGEPGILDEVQQRLGLHAESVSESWRSSSVVLDVVNRIFDGIEDREVLSRDREAVLRWSRAFQRHHPARDLPGYVRLEAGPLERGNSQRSFRPALLAHAAAEVARLHRSAPGAKIGILTRTNRSAAFLFAHLRRAGLDASEEGGVPVADSAPVLAILALLRMVDHPADTIARYLVMKTPAASLLRLTSAEWRDEEALGRQVRTLRRRLLSEGYGRVLSDWTSALAGQVSRRDARRLRQLTELAFRWDDRATGRPSDFVRVAEAARAEDPASALVRVMTIHGAKGLEFDAVVLPDLDGLSLSGDRGNAPMALRTGGTGPVQRVLPRVKQELLPLFPELTEAAAQEKETGLRDGLSSLYVGLTRARYAVYIYVSPDPKGTSTARTGARVVREALAPGRVAEPGSALFCQGRADWWKAETADPRLASKGLRPDRGASRLRSFSLAPSPRRRMLLHRPPSSLLAAGESRLARLFRPESRVSREHGIAVHLWLAKIEWIEAGMPSDEELLEEASTLVPRAEGLPHLLERFHEWLEQPEIRGLLSEARFPAGTRVERELPFIVREEDLLVEGRADRVLWVPGATGAQLVIVDWKSEPLDLQDRRAVERAVDRHRPQVDAYRRALSTAEGIPIDRVEGLLAFVSSGIVRRVSSHS